MNAALVISERDNVATALEPLEPGRAIQAGNRSIEVTESIPRGHKMALHAIAAGEPVVKYGSPIGTASTAIAAGAHVHTHNVASARGRGDLAGAAQLGSVRLPRPRSAESAEGEPDQKIQRSDESDTPRRSDPRIAEPPEAQDAEPPATPRPR